MLSDDVFRGKLRAIVADLERAVAPLAANASVDIAQTPEHTRLALIPHTQGACPVEIMLRADQMYDIAIASEFYEDCRIERLDLFQPLLMAIADGNVIQRHHVSAATGAERAVETIVTLPGGALWQKGYEDARVAGAIGDEQTVLRDRRFLPYKR